MGDAPLELCCRSPPPPLTPSPLPPPTPRTRATANASLVRSERRIDFLNCTDCWVCRLHVKQHPQKNDTRSGICREEVAPRFAASHLLAHIPSNVVGCPIQQNKDASSKELL